MPLRASMRVHLVAVVLLLPRVESPCVAAGATSACPRSLTSFFYTWGGVLWLRAGPRRCGACRSRVSCARVHERARSHALAHVLAVPHRMPVALAALCVLVPARCGSVESGPLCVASSSGTASCASQPRAPPRCAVLHGAVWCCASRRHRSVQRASPTVAVRRYRRHGATAARGRCNAVRCGADGDACARGGDTATLRPHAPRVCKRP